MGQLNYQFYLLLCSVIFFTTTSGQNFYCLDGDNSCVINNYDESTSVELASYLYKENVKRLQIRNCNISYIQSDIFRQFPSLIELDMSHCGLDDIRPDTFSAATNLIDLNLSNNNLIVLTDFGFKGANKLMHIDLSDNRIQIINRNAFISLTTLTKINLSRNPLTNASIEVIGNVDSLEELSFQRNSLTSLSFLKYLSNLKVLDLSYNSLRMINTDAKVFNNLVNLKHLILKSVELSQVLDLHANYIFTSTLEILDISDNNLKLIDIRYLINLDNLLQLYITGNPYIHTQAFQSAISLIFPKLSVLDISADNWQCTEIAILSKRIKSRGIKIPLGKVWGYQTFEGIPCEGELYTKKFNYTVYGYEADENGQRFDKLEQTIYGLTRSVDNTIYDSYGVLYNYFDNIGTMIIIILSIIIVLLVVCVANIIIFICLRRKLIRKGLGQQSRSSASVIDDRTALIQ